MKSSHEREQLIKDINVLLTQAYDSTLDEIHALLKRIDDVDDDEDLKAIKVKKLEKIYALMVLCLGMKFKTK
ncbi:hypothetical protein [Nostoc sp. NMS8]|uniref:hypothetical protein n=1 Tax=Nostoc sp. NMS8 TaxID=2815392 RepID=UPI0034581530